MISNATVTKQRKLRRQRKPSYIEEKETHWLKIFGNKCGWLIVQDNELITLDCPSLDFTNLPSHF